MMWLRNNSVNAFSQESKSLVLEEVSSVFPFTVFLSQTALQSEDHDQQAQMLAAPLRSLARCSTSPTCKHLYYL